MKKLRHRLIASAIAAAAVFALASLLRGDQTHLKQLTSSVTLRLQMSDVASKIEELKSPAVSMTLEAGDSYKQYLQEQVIDRLHIKTDPNSPYSLKIKVDEKDRTIITSISLQEKGKDILTKDQTTKLPDWKSLLPALLAIVLAIFLRKVLTSLAIAIWFGAILHYSHNPFTAAVFAAKKYIWGSFIGEFSLLILGFVFILVGMVNIINRGGGMAGVVNQITKIARCAKTACISATCLGTLIFFDDYTNCIVVGTTMRSFTDKMKVSREKLSYIVDTTAAPVAGLAMLSTWIGFEVSQLQGVAKFIGSPDSGYSLFLQAVPYRFYCIFSIFLVFFISIFRRDFGPMLKAERRAFLKNQVDDPDTNEMADSMIKAANPKKGVPERWYNAAIPVFSVLVFMLTAIIWRGSQLLANVGMKFDFTIKALRECFIQIGGDGNNLFIIMLLASAFGALVAAVLMAAQRILSLKEIAISFLSGWKIIPAASILILAWAIRYVCDDLGTALFLSSLLKGSIDPHMIPLVIFLLAAAVSFATGTSFGTMGLLLPTVGPIAYVLGSPAIFVMSLGAVLDGSIFGDHCSPISDTTVLSAVASSCDLVDHVKTQLPYAVLCMLVAGLVGYVPAALGASVLPLYGIGIASLLLVLFLIGRNPEANLHKVREKITKDALAQATE